MLALIGAGRDTTSHKGSGLPHAAQEARRGWHSPMIRMFVRDVVPFTDSKTEERRKRRRSHFSGALMAPRAGAQPVRGRAGIFCEPSSKPVTAGLGAESSAFFFYLSSFIFI